MALNAQDLAAIRQLVKEELAISRTADPEDFITAGPDEDGRVRFLGTEQVNKNCLVLSVLTVRQAAEGRIPALNEKQLATLMMNVGCNEQGDLLPIFGREYGQTGNPVIDQTTYMANTVEKQPGTFWQPNRWAFGPAFRQSDDDRTISSRSEKIGTLVESVRGLGKLHENDGSAFRT